jgi:hypothetical protein
LSDIRAIGLSRSFQFEDRRNLIHLIPNLAQNQKIDLDHRNENGPYPYYPMTLEPLESDYHSTRPI